jgi:hypothetical protein
MVYSVPPLRGFRFCLHGFPPFQGGLRSVVPPGLRKIRNRRLRENYNQVVLRRAPNLLSYHALVAGDSRLA